MKTLRFFLKYLDKIVGSRTSDESFVRAIPDAKDRILYIIKFYDECPPLTWLGETDRNTFYIKKTFWAILTDVIIVKGLIKKHPSKFFEYTKMLIKDIYNTPRRHAMYMNPNVDEFYK